ncbi:hypothetical protein AB6H27_17550 [Providencia huaxiensis]|nr:MULTISPECIES: hypothetical protein [Providencia]HCI95127.1 hypothetical protein [Providencia sp.]ELR5055490.1 hypothetical protein [Providencia rettgeri]ELR5087944.1 hypothetical protein [Providencia rettgeri]ELR5107208.1 hypothetical protein [Providencia rettgeri]ELR5282163.1 hypothetical protein [Providencia rettgeri]
MATISQPQRFINALNKLEVSSKVSKKPLNELNKLVGNIAKITNSTDSSEFNRLMSGGTEVFESRIDKLITKLNSQNSGMLQEKSTKLNFVKTTLLASIGAKEKCTLETKKLNLIEKYNNTKNELNGIKNDIIKTEEKINKKKLEIEFLKTPDVVSLLAEDHQGLVTEKIATAIENYNKGIKQLDTAIENNKNKSLTKRNELVKKIPDIGDSLDKAIKGEIFKVENSGFFGEIKTTWKSYLTSDSFAMKKFGFELKDGHKEFSGKTKVPNLEGRNFTENVQQYFVALDKIQELQNKKNELSTEHENKIQNYSKELNVSVQNYVQEKMNSCTTSLNKLQTELDKQNNTKDMYQNQLAGLETSITSN